MFSEGNVVILESRASGKFLRINGANIFESLGSRPVPCPRKASWSGYSTECAHTSLVGYIQGQTVGTVKSVLLCSYNSLKARLCEGGKGACPKLADLYHLFLIWELVNLLYLVPCVCRKRCSIL